MREKLARWIYEKKWIQLISFLVFCALAVRLFLNITYLFRSAGAGDSSEIYNRNRIIGIKEEAALDMVYVSGSEGFVYWEPPRAWAEYGFKSYNYATNSIPAEAILGNIREIRKTQEPQLFVVGLRSFQYWSEGVAEAEIRYITDSMDYSWNRWRMVHEYLANRTVTEENHVLSLYFDIAKYHTNTEVLKAPERWKLSDNRGTAQYNGWLLYPFHEILGEPEGFMTEERAELAKGSRDTLVALLEYCQEEDLDVLFVISPYWITKEHQMLYNTMKDLITSYGFDYLNANEHYEEIGIDFATDFCDKDHVDVYGAEKYTRFLGRYIQEKYALVDKRNETGNDEWDEMYEAFRQKESAEKDKIEEEIVAENLAYTDGLSLENIDNPYEWCAKAVNENYTVLVAAQGEAFSPNAQIDAILDLWEIPRNSTANVIRVYSGKTNLFMADDTLEENCQGTFRGHTDRVEAYEINSGEKCGIIIGGVEHCLKQNGLNIVVYDNNYREVLDSVVITQGEDGELSLLRR
ncbi:MAG: hypothetical protein K2P65_06510 [Lachnospiraceae bacterium]|nr:hypothetical protein [Lachnospiraceae bacterium]